MESDFNDEKFHTAVIALITGETKWDGVLNIIGTNEGFEVGKHLCISGDINAAAQDYAINATTDNVVVIFVKGGKIYFNSGLGNEGEWIFIIRFK